MLLSIYMKGWQPRWPFAARIALFIAGLICWLIASIACEVHADAPHTSTTPQAITGWLLILSGVILFFLSLYGAPKKYMPPTLAYLGRISYGMYIFHITMFWIIYQIYKNELAVFSNMIGLAEWKNEVGFVIAFVATLVIALLSYRFFEKPFLRLKRRFTFIPSRD